MEAETETFGSTWNLSPLDLRILQGTSELDDSQMLRTYVQSGLLEVEVVTQTRRTCTRRDEARIGEMSGLQQASRLWRIWLKELEPLSCCGSEGNEYRR